MTLITSKSQLNHFDASGDVVNAKIGPSKIDAFGCPRTNIKLISAELNLVGQIWISWWVQIKDTHFMTYYKIYKVRLEVCYQMMKPKIERSVGLHYIN